MTDLQLVLTISIPSLLVVLSWIQSNSRLARVEAAVASTNKRIDDLQRQMHSDFLGVYSELNRLYAEMSRVRG